jgi:hypothetical protein
MEPSYMGIHVSKGYVNFMIFDSAAGICADGIPKRVVPTATLFSLHKLD